MWTKLKEKQTNRSHTMTFQEWMMANLMNEDKGVEFGIVCWHLWKQRCEETMEGKAFNAQGLLCRIKAWFNIYEHAQQSVRNITKAQDVHKHQEQISWRPPPEGWIQVQSDGSVLTPTGKAAAGGLIRDHQGKCHAAFVCNFGVCSITSAELKGAAEGLRLAYNKGYKKVQLNLDSSTAVAIIKNHKDENHRHGIFANQFNFLLNLDWDVKVEHVYREANFAADFLANRGHLYDFGTHSFDVCDPGLNYWMYHDIVGVTHDRFIPSMN
ncbi:unnamed protein product [Linum tenue]|uniref:RNase H type-1 domain-containing protein n=1 Tax=Linum tenue TaxID=586396 RepID=A0AAV0PC28_9ROSI|nr:unnamed protein product [Linum tenue]